MPQYLNKKQLKKIGFKKIGKNCRISITTRGHSLNCTVGNNVRIDDNVVLKGKINIKSNVHIARGCTLSGGNLGIYLDNFSTLSNFCQLFTKSDDYFFPCLSGGTLSEKDKNKFSKIHNKKILIGKAVIVGAFSVLLPGANLGNFSTAGAYSLINKKIPAGYYFSNLITKKENLKKRDLLKLNQIYKKAISNKL